MNAEALFVKPTNMKGSSKMKILFINGSPEHNGNTEHLAQAMLGGREYETVELG